MVIVLGAASPAPGWPAPFTPPQTPHPAVVRVIVPERGGASLGSGSLVAVDATHGLVITNWHVVRDVAGPITVVFPDGFRSSATLLRVDHDWDLAALAIARPNVQPIALSATAPRPGETLTIAGYGSGSYRAAAGRCTEYVSPGGSHPYEMVEVSTGARFGDSGGPILNQRGELAGVLFGSALGRTTGSYCGRVRNFLVSVSDDFRRVPSSPTMIAQQPPPPTAPQSAPPAALVDKKAEPASLPTPPLVAVTPAPVAPVVASAPAPAAVAAPLPALPSRGDQIKTILAAIGVIAILFHAIRLLGAAAG
jgi:S1-C subfamily serine protease